MPSPPPPEPRRGRRALVLLGLTVAVMSIVYPLRQYNASKAELRALLRREKQVEAQTRVLERQRDRLSSDAEVERLAREHLHMVRPGEIAFAITGSTPTPRAVAPTKPASKQKPDRPWYRSFWQWLTGG